MNDAFSSFVVGFICTGALFALCFLVVVGFKVVILAIKDRLSKQEPVEVVEQPKPRSPKKRKRKPKSYASSSRSIEIDPEQIDRIYVKKIS